jgi:hypothetical protein
MPLGHESNGQSKVQYNEICVIYKLGYAKFTDHDVLRRMEEVKSKALELCS